MTQNPYAESVATYAEAGWSCILPVPLTDKFPPPVGFTGAEGRDTDPLDLVEFATRFPPSAVALRMPPGVLGIDVDQYEKGGVQKRGAETLQACQQRWGPLPATWTSTAREADGPSRIYLYRVPAQRYATKLTDPEGGTSDVDVIQQHHRYAVVWPSPHTSGGSATGGTYTWYDPTGAPSERPPSPAELAELPEAWVAGLAEGAASQGAAMAAWSAGEALLDQLEDDHRPECAEVTNARLSATDKLSRADAGSRHDVMTERVHHVVQLAAAGHPGAGGVLLGLRAQWAAMTPGEGREDELHRMLLTSARKAVTAVGAHQVPRDPCLMVAGGQILPPNSSGADHHQPVTGEVGPQSPDTGAGEALGGEQPLPLDGASQAGLIGANRQGQVKAYLGAHTFDPTAQLDQPLAQAVLERTYPALRYAYDAGTWLLRGPETWEDHPDLDRWAVSEVAALMPVGNPEAEKGSDEHTRSARRARLMSSAGASAVAGKINALVAGGMHPCAVRLGALDTDPAVLWAGGWPWSLRASTHAAGPVPADLDPATPHLLSAGYVPRPGPTPLWDAYVAAVWPDPEVRAWALRVLSIALTGYSDRALPILLGETGRGKTQIVALIMDALGTYAHTADTRLLSPAPSAHASIVYALKGKRLSFIDEAPRDSKSGQERLKQLTGGADQTANKMHQDPVTFRPTHTLVLTANHEPELTDPAVRSRARLIPCEGDPEAVSATRAALGHLSGPVWRAEAPAVLAALMGEAAGWLADPRTASVLAAPESIRWLAEQIGAEQDPVQRWLADETEPYDVGTGSRELYQDFRASCLRSGVRGDLIPSETTWGRTLTQQGYPSVHTREGKRRALRVKLGGGGFLPGMPPLTTTYDVTGGDGSVTGFDPNPSQTNPEVGPQIPGFGDGLTGLLFQKSNNTENGIDTHTHTTHTHTYKNTGGSTRQPVTEPPGEAPKPQVNPGAAPCDGLGVETRHQPDTEPVTVHRVTPAKERAKLAREAKRAAAIVAASGERVPLPAVVTRAGNVAPVDLDTARRTLAGVLTPGTLTVDVEHTGYPIGHADYALRTVQLGDDARAVVLDANDPEHADLARLALDTATTLHAHSATADLVPLALAGILDPETAWPKVIDTAILAKLTDPGLTGNDADLKDLSRAVLGDAGLSHPADRARAALFAAGKWLTNTDATTPLIRSGWAQADPTSTTMVRYAAADVLDAHAIATRLPPIPPAVLDRERAVQRIVAKISQVGVRLDAEHVDRKHAEHTAAKAEHATTVRTLGALDRDGADGNPNSNDQLGEAFTRLGVHLPRTGTGKPSVAEAVLAPMAERAETTGHPADVLAQQVLTYRHHHTALKLFLNPYRELTHRGDGRARPTVYTLGADTGRMSCVRPNMQQLPREGGMRACITAEPGHLLVSADFAGVELRVAAALSGDRNLLAILNDPERDLHWEIARVAFGPQATKAQRYRVKRGVFGRIYGGGVTAVAAGVGVDLPTGQRVIDAMDTITPELAEWSRMLRGAIEAGRTHYPTAAGRVIHLPTDAPHAGPNYAIQGTARELLVDALLAWSRTRWGSAVVWPVHDEVVAVIPEDQADDATATLTECMTTELAGVPIIAEASTPSYAWADAS